MRAFGVTVVGIVFLLAICGGCGSDSNPTDPPPPPATAEGRFVDAVVHGLGYSSGELNGTTDASGTFAYEVGSSVTFSIGAVVVGSVTGAEIISPVDLTGGNSAGTETLNIVRFLLMLDSDGDGANGIVISDAVRTVAEGWSQPNFSTAMSAGDLAAIMSDVATADSRVPVLPAAAAARSHLELTLACLSSGVFRGSFSGDDNGTYLLWIQHERFDPLAFGDDTPRVGVTSALVFSTDENIVSGVAPQQGLSYDVDRQFLSGLVSTGAEFSGELQDYKTITNGTWVNGPANESGTFSGQRIGGREDAVYRLSGFFNLQGHGFSADNSGVVALDIMADDSVVGVLVTLRGNETPLTGTRSGGGLSVSGGGNSFALSFDPDGSDPANDAALGTTSGFIGTMTNTNGTSDVVGTSCRPY